jgi:hypothetical protein
VSDNSTLEGMISELRLKTSSGPKKAIVVMDAGIATASNLLMLKEKGYDYLCVARSTMKNYLLESEGNEVSVTDRCNRKISLQKVSSGKDDDYCLKIANSLGKKGGVKQEDRVYGRIGRLKQKYPSIHRHFDIHCEAVTETKKRKPAKSGKAKEEKRVVTSLDWSVKEDSEINSRSGIYFLRTSLKESEKILWQTYNTIREIEYTNRVLKTDLDLRPIYHKKDETSLAHLHLGLLAYWVEGDYRVKVSATSLYSFDPTVKEVDVTVTADGAPNPSMFTYTDFVATMLSRFVAKASLQQSQAGVPGITPFRPIIQRKIIH